MGDSLLKAPWSPLRDLLAAPPNTLPGFMGSLSLVSFLGFLALASFSRRESFCSEEMHT